MNRDDSTAGQSRVYVERLSQGDEGALDQLLQMHLPGLRGFIQRRAGQLVLGKESATDLLQSVCRDVLQHALDGRFQYQGEAQFKQWLYQAALLKLRDRRNYYLAGKRDAALERPASPTESDVRTREFLASLCSPSRAAVKQEELEIVQWAFANLSQQQRDLIVFIKVEGRSHQDVAEQLNISTANSRTLLSRALARLASLVKDSSQFPVVGAMPS